MGKRDTLTVKDDEGNDIIIMKAVRDEETGEMVATDVIDAAVITARFRNIAERLGQIDIRFDIRVPASMQDSKWQLRLYPHLYVMADSLQLPGVILTGTDYRKEQLRGYQLYERYLRSIITDSTRFVDWRNLNIWIERNLAPRRSRCSRIPSSRSSSFSRSCWALPCRSRTAMPIRSWALSPQTPLWPILSP